MVPNAAVVVWQLRGFIEDVQCFFYRRGRAFVLGIDRAGELLLEETYDDLRELTARANEVQRSLEGVGFERVRHAEPQAHPPLELLLEHFVKQGTTPLMPAA
jgi:hypothetical protein